MAQWSPVAWSLEPLDSALCLPAEMANTVSVDKLHATPTPAKLNPLPSHLTNKQPQPINAPKTIYTLSNKYIYIWTAGKYGRHTTRNTSEANAPEDNNTKTPKIMYLTYFNHIKCFGLHKRVPIYIHKLNAICTKPCQSHHIQIPAKYKIMLYGFLLNIYYINPILIYTVLPANRTKIHSLCINMQYPQTTI